MQRTILGFALWWGVAGLLGGEAEARGQDAPAVQLLPAGGFATDLKTWERSGKAEFAADADLRRAGRATARIAIGPEIEPSYQQIRRDFRDDIRPDDTYRGCVWVQSRGITNARGPYLAVEFLDTQGRRTGIAHSGAIVDTDAQGWQQLVAEGAAPAGTTALRFSMVLHARGQGWFADPELVRTERPEPWPDLGDRTRSIAIDADRVLDRAFRGVGFHAFHHIFPASRREMDEVVVKRWRELRPSYARINHESRWDRAKLDQVAEHLRPMKELGTELYVTTWDPEVTKTDAEREAYVRKVVDQLEYLIRDKGLDNITTYCMTNEMSLGRWGALLTDLPTFRAYQESFFREFQRRGLKVGLLATDAAPAENWGTLAWASQHMDPITSVYGGHHYFSDRDLDDERVYPWFLKKTRWAVELAAARGKPFILGEFGSKQDGRVVNGVTRDVCVYFDTPREPMVALQLADAVIAAMNAGTHAMCYWTFMDVPDEFVRGYLNKWGLFRCSGEDRSTRSIYYGYGLLTRAFHGPGEVLAVSTDDPRVRASALHRSADGSWSIAVVNRNARAVPIRVSIRGGAKLPRSFEKFVYDPAHVEQNPFGDLPGPTGELMVGSEGLVDRVGPMSLTVYTTRIDRTPPAAVTQVKVVGPESGPRTVTWTPVADRDLAYYRVHRGATQIGSTVATQFVDAHPEAKAVYRVLAVDLEGNAAPEGRESP